MSYFGNREWLADVAQGRVQGYSIFFKYGRNAAVGASPENISPNGIATYPSAGTLVRVRAGGNANDTAAGSGARTIRIYGCSNTGATINEDISLAGASASANTVAYFLRVWRAYVLTSGTYNGTNVGDIIIETTGGTEHTRIIAAEGQTQHGQWTTPANTNVYLLDVHGTSEATKPSVIRLFNNPDLVTAAAPFGSPRLKLQWDGVDGSFENHFAAPMKISDGATAQEFWFDAACPTGAAVSITAMCLHESV